MKSSRLSVEQERTLLRSSNLVERAGSADAARIVLDRVGRLNPLERVTCARAYSRWLSSSDHSAMSDAGLLLSAACYHWLWDEREAGRDWDPRPWWVPIVLAITPRVFANFMAFAVVLAVVSALAWVACWFGGCFQGGGL